MTGADDGADAGNIFSSGGELIDIASADWQRVPTAALKALLAQRRAGGDGSACGSGKLGRHYNTSLHVFALFLILFLSTAACSFPIIVRRFPNLAVPPRVLFLSRHFGTGVLIATAFVHLLPTAFVSLTEPCLPPFFNVGYPALPGVIAMTAVMIVVGIEMFFASRGAGHVHSIDFESLVDPLHKRELSADGGARGVSVKRFQHTSRDRPPRLNVPQEDETGETARLVTSRSPNITPEPSPMPLRPPASRPDTSDESATPTPPDDDDSDLDLELNELDPMPSTSNNHSRQPSHQLRPRIAHQRHSSHTVPEPTTAAGQKKLLLQCLLLEAGILFHSVFIGMALSVSTGAAFAVFLIAISFHQTFEGLALGARISAIHFSSHSPKPWLMALAFGATTPAGQAIGLLIHNLYDPQSQTGLIVVGVTNAVSSGLLLFAGLVELLAEDLLSDESYITLVGRRRLEACAAVVSGAVLMALVGAWA